MKLQPPLSKPAVLESLRLRSPPLSLALGSVLGHRIPTFTPTPKTRKNTQLLGRGKGGGGRGPRINGSKDRFKAHG